MELIDVTDIASATDFKVFRMASDNGGVVKALNAKGAADKYSRKELDRLGQFVGQFGAKGLAWIKVDENGELTGPIAKFMGGVSDELKKATNAEAGDVLMFAADQFLTAVTALGAVRFDYLWVVDWPQFEFDQELGRYVSAHHPFTMPMEKDIENLKEHPEKVYAQAYDIVLNGYELGGGSLRINTRELQEQVFETLGFTRESANEQFGFLLEALDYGFPPIGGIALGLDRFAMLLANEDNIREVIAFPKNGKAAEPMTDAPSTVSPLQLYELSIDVTKIEE